MINRVILMGNLTRNPESRNGNSGKTFCTFTIAYNSFSKDANGEKVKNVSYIPCVAFGFTAEYIVKNIRSGNLVAVEGKLAQRSYIRSDNTKGSTLEVIVDSIQSLNFTKGEVANEEQDIPPYQENEPTDDGSKNIDVSVEDDGDNKLPF